MAEFDPFAIGAEPIDDAAKPAAAAAFDPFKAGAEPLDPAPFDPFKSGAEPLVEEHKPKFTTFEEFTAPVGQAFANLPARSAQVRDFVKLLFQKPIDEFMGDHTASIELADKMAKRSQQLAADREVVVQASGEAGGVATDVASAAADLIPQLLLSGGASLIGTAKTAITMSASLSGLQSAANSFAGNVAERTAKGEKLGEAAEAEFVPALASGAITGIVTKAFGATGIESIFKAAGGRGVAGKLFQVLKEAGGEGAEEMTDEAGQIINDLVNNKGVSLGEAAKRVAYSGFIGSVLGGGVNGLHQAMTSFRPDVVEAEGALSRARTIAPQTAAAAEKEVATSIAEAEVALTPAAAAEIAGKTSEEPPAGAAPGQEAPAKESPFTRIARAQNELKVAKASNDEASQAAALATLDAIAVELTGGAEAEKEANRANVVVDSSINPNRELTPETVLHPGDTAMAKAAAESLGLVFDGIQGDTAVNITNPETGDTYTMSQGSTVADLNAKIAEKAAARAAAEAAKATDQTVPPVIPQAPLPEVAPPPTKAEVAKAGARTPEEKAAQLESGTTAAREAVTKTGIVPTYAKLQKALGNPAEAKKLRAELQAQIVAAHPAEPVPEGATVSTTKNALTGDELPSVNEGGKLRPQFTNDPNLTAQQIDLGQAGTDKAARLYVPDEIMDNDQLNPAIDTAYDKEAGKFYVTAVNSEYGRVEKPDDFAGPYKAAKTFQKAHQLVLAGGTQDVQNLHDFVTPEENTVGQALTENGFAADAIPFDPTEADIPEGATAIASAGAATLQQAQQNVTSILDTDVSGSPRPKAIVNLVQGVVDKSVPAQPWMRIIAQNLIKTGIDLSKVSVEVVNQPQSKWAGFYKVDPTDVSKGTIVVNLGVAHEGGLMATAFHELFHHASLVKLDPDYKRNKVEQKAYENLIALWGHASREIYKINFGQYPTEEELNAWQADQSYRTAQDTQRTNRTYYGLINPSEFVTEVLTNPKFMKALSQIAAHPDVKVSGKFKNLLLAVRDAIRTLFTGVSVRNSTMNQAIDQAMSLIGSGRVTQARASNTAYTQEPAFSTGKPPVMITDDGWLSPDGKFHPAPMVSGGHQMTAFELIETNPKLAEAIPLVEETQSGASDGWDSVQKIYDFMEKHGFVRVVDGGPGGTIYINGKPSRSQLQILKDNAIEKKASLVQDFGTRSRTLFSPGDAFTLPPGQPTEAEMDQMHEDLAALGFEFDLDDRIYDVRHLINKPRPLQEAAATVEEEEFRQLATKANLRGRIPIAFDRLPPAAARLVFQIRGFNAQNKEGIAAEIARRQADIDFFGNMFGLVEPNQDGAASAAGNRRSTTALAGALESASPFVQRALKDTTYLAGNNAEDLAAVKLFIDENTNGGAQLGELVDMLDIDQDSRFPTIKLDDVQRGLARIQIARTADKMAAQLADNIANNRPVTDTYGRTVGIDGPGQALLVRHYQDIAVEQNRIAQIELSRSASYLSRVGALTAKMFTPAKAKADYADPIKSVQQTALRTDPEAKGIRAAFETVRQEAATIATDKADKVIRLVTGLAQDSFNFFEEVFGKGTMEKSGQWLSRYATGTGLPVTTDISNDIAAQMVKTLSPKKAKNSPPTPALDLLQAEVQKQVALQIEAALPKKAPAPVVQAAVEAFIRDTDHAALMEQAFNTAAAAIRNNPNVPDATKAALVDAKFDLGKLKSAQELVRQYLTLKDVVHQNLSSQEATRDNLIHDILEQAPHLTEAQTGAVVKALTSAFDLASQQELRTQLGRLTRTRGPAKPITNRTEDYLKLARFGAYSDAALYNTIATNNPQLKLPVYDPAFLAKLDRESQLIMRMPEDSDLRRTAVTKLNGDIANEQINNLKGWPKSWHYVSKVAPAVWQAGVLSGPPTQLVNLGATATNVQLQSFFDALGYATAAIKAGAPVSQVGNFFADGVMGWFNQGKARTEFRRALTTGVSKFRSERGEGASILETLSPKNPYALGKWVLRLASASDGFNSTNANEIKQRMALRFSMLVEGKSAAEIDAAISDAFNPAKDVYDQILAQVAQEADQGLLTTDLNKEIRINELLEKRRNDIEPGLVEAARQTAEEWTFNGQPKGVAGLVFDGAIGSMNRAFPPAKFFFSFMRTMANLLNTTLDFSPVGVARAYNFHVSSGLSKTSKFRYADLQRGSPEFYAKLGQGVAGTAAIFALAAMAMKGLEDEKDGKEPFFGVYGAGPSTAIERRQLIEGAGWQPNSIKIGSHRFNYTDWPVLNLALGAIGTLADDVRFKRNEDTPGGERAMLLGLGLMNVIMSKRLLQGASNLFTVIQNPDQRGINAAKLITSGIVGGFTNPQALKWARNTLGMGKDGMVPVLDASTTKGWLFSMMPASVGYNQAGLNVLGEEVKEFPWVATTKRFGVFDPVERHPVLTPLVSAGLMVPPPNKNVAIAIKDQVIPMGRNPELYRQFVKYRGDALKNILTPEQVERLTGMEQSAAQDLLKGVVNTRANNVAKNQIAADIKAGRLTVEFQKQNPKIKKPEPTATTPPTTPNRTEENPPRGPDLE